MARTIYGIREYTVTLDDAVHFIDGIDKHLARYVRDVRKYEWTVIDEVEKISDTRTIDPALHARTCICFAILSPQCRFDVNVRATVRLVDHLFDQIGDSQSIHDILTNHGKDNFLSATPVSRRIFASLAYLRGVDESSLTLEAMRQAKKDGVLTGMGDKTMRMAIALNDANADVYTLDVHMLRGIQISWGGIIAGGMSITPAAYDAIEAAMVAWHHRHFPELPVFVSQWALWNAWGFGVHQSHLPIFGLGEVPQ